MNKSEIEQALHYYFDGSYEGDSRKMRQVFHPAAHIYGLDADGALTDWTLDDFADIVDNVVKPKDSGQKREDEIIAIDFTGENTAAARVRLRVGQTKYTDILSFIRLNGEWRIIAKVLSGVEIANK